MSRRGALHRLSDVVHWTDVDKCLVINAATAPFVLVIIAVTYWLERSELGYISHEGARLFRQLLSWYFIGWLVQGAWALAVRKSGRSSEALVHATVLYYMAGTLVGGHFVGPTIGPYTSGVVMGATIVAYLFFGVLRMTPLLLLAIVLIGLDILAVQIGRLQHAPILAGPPWEGNRPATSWLVAMGISVSGVLVICTFVTAWVIRQWHRHEEELAEANAFLEQAVAELNETQERLVRAESLASVGSLVRGATRRLSEPLGAAQALADRLAGMLKGSATFCGKSRGDAVETLGMAARGSRRAALIVSRLRSLSEHDEITLAERPAAGLLEAIRRDHPDVRLESGELPERLLCAESAIAAIVGDLLDNARRAGGSEPPALTLHTDNGRLVLTVSDNGRGIAPEHRAQVFKPFFTTEKAGADHGVGLGLYVVHELVARLDGTIRLESAPGRGTRVEVRLPL